MYFISHDGDVERLWAIGATLFAETPATGSKSNTGKISSQYL